MDHSAARESALLRRLTLACLAVCSLCLFLLLFLQIYSTDDYIYLSFLDRGLSGFVEEMKWHYSDMNGRLWIHAVACVALHFGHLAVGVLGLAIVWACCVLGLRLCGTKRAALTGAAVFFAGFLLLPDLIMQRGVLWTAAFYNYVFPILPLLTLLLLLRRQRQAGRLRLLNVLALVAAACLSGASTELFGLLSCVLLVWELGWSLLRREKRSWLTLLALAAAAGGLALIVLSPATSARAESELQLSLQMAKLQLAKHSALFQSSGRLLLLLAALQLALLCFGGRQSRLLRLLCAAGMLLPGLLYVLPEQLAGQFLYPAMLAVLLAEALLFAKRGEMGLASLLLAAPMSLLLMLFNDSTHYRTLASFSTFVLLALAACVERSERKDTGKNVVKIAVPLLLTLGACVVVLPTVPARWSNYRVDRQNEANAARAAQSGEMELCLDYDLNYTYESIFIPDHRLFPWYLKHYGLEKDKTRFRETGRTVPAVLVNGKELQASAFPGTSSVLYPVSAMLDALGADWERPAADRFLIRWNGASYTILPNESENRYANAKLVWTDSSGTAQERIVWLVPSSYSEERYLTQDVFAQLFGLRFRRTRDSITVELEP